MAAAGKLPGGARMRGRVGMIVGPLTRPWCVCGLRYGGAWKPAGERAAAAATCGGKKKGMPGGAAVLSMGVRVRVRARRAFGVARAGAGGWSGGDHVEIISRSNAACGEEGKIFSPARVLFFLEPAANAAGLGVQRPRLFYLYFL